MSGFNVLKPGSGNKAPSEGFSSVRRYRRGMFTTPDTVEILVQPKSRQTRDGTITPGIGTYGDYIKTGIKFKAYTYLATGRYFSTKVTPSEYGDGDVFDGLIALIQTRGYSKEEIAHLKPTAIVSVTRKGYDADRVLYRIETGNPYPEHVEYKMVPILL